MDPLNGFLSQKGLASVTLDHLPLLPGSHLSLLLANPRTHPVGYANPQRRPTAKLLFPGLCACCLTSCTVYRGCSLHFFFPFQSFTSCSLCRSLWPGVSLQLPSSTPSPANNTNLRIFFILSHKAFLCLPCSLLCLGKKSVHRTSTRISLKLVLKTHFCCETLEKREGGLVTEIRKESPNLALASAAAICACVSADLFMIFQSSPSFFLFLPHLFLVPHPQFMLNINYAPQQRHRVFTCILNSAAFFFFLFLYIFFSFFNLKHENHC